MSCGSRTGHVRTALTSCSTRSSVVATPGRAAISTSERRHSRPIRSPRRHSCWTGSMSTHAVRIAREVPESRESAHRGRTGCIGSLHGDGESTCKRGSVPGFLAEVPFGSHPSMRSTWGYWPGRPPRSDLAPGGGCLAARVTPDAGALLPHPFTLTCAAPANRCRHRRSALCCPDPTGHPVLTLVSTVPYGAPTFLEHVECVATPFATAATRTTHRRNQCRGAGEWGVT